MLQRRGCCIQWLDILDKIWLEMNTLESGVAHIVKKMVESCFRLSGQVWIRHVVIFVRRVD